MDRVVERAKIKVRGIVQGVGFRPYVYNLAESLNLRGYVTNTSDGVDIDIEGEKLSDFMRRLSKEAPSLSKIAEIDVSPLPVYGYADFRIMKSEDDGRFTLISPDVSVCSDCLKELFDPDNRRYLYPFINCTNCGPRYTITRAVPYDRPNTTMSVFEMCDECYKEYNDPKDRRFHAQPNACTKCGPQVTLVTNCQSSVITHNPIEKAIGLLKDGAIVAIKGLGGFHIACDATNEDAVKRLRERKRRVNKPFALMAPDIRTIERFCDVSEEEGILLQDIRRPVVLLKKRGKDYRENSLTLPEKIAPKNKYLGFMLPYTPLHYLLFHYPITHNLSPSNHHFHALVMTSGNISEEPIVKDNEEAMRRLSGIADAFLLHNRDIFMRVDDSVVRVTSNELKSSWFIAHSHGPSAISHQPDLPLITRHSSLSFIRRSRGYSPEPVLLHGDGPDVLGCGADLKNTFTVTKGMFAIPSQHIGDMENYETLRFFEESLENIKAVYRVKPVAVAHDLHPDYLSTRWVLQHAKDKKLGRWDDEKTRHLSFSASQPLIFGIQHHYAHIASVMAENGLNGKVIGIVFDGTGYGTDGNLWGGEFLIAGIDGFERVGHFRYIPIPGGEMAIKETWRTGVSYVVDALKDGRGGLEAIGFVEKYGRDNIEKLIRVAQIRELSPLSSGAGRLFDAVSAIMGICDRNTFEGEAAMALESIIADGIDEGYPVEIALSEEREHPGETVPPPGIVVSFSQTITGIIQDLIDGVDRPVISAKFHNTIASVILSVVKKIAADYGLDDVVLSGGTFQNLYLLERTVRMLTAKGMNVFINKKVPCNDAGISLGQAYLVRERLRYGVHHG